MTCIGFAWSSPEIVLIDIDRNVYRTFQVREANSRRDLDLFMEAQDPREVVVVVNGVAALARVADVKAKFVVCDTIDALRTIKGAVIIDHEPGGDDCAMRRISLDDLRAALAGPMIPFTVPSDVVQVSTTLASKITMRELMDKVVRKGAGAITDDFVVRTCERIVGRITKANWVARVRKPALAAGLDTQILAELERFVEDGSVSDGLWRGFYDLVEIRDPMDVVLKKYDVRQSDLEFLVDLLGNEAIGPEAYAANPTKTKKRKV